MLNKQLYLQTESELKEKHTFCCFSYTHTLARAPVLTHVHTHLTHAHHILLKGWGRTAWRVGLWLIFLTSALASSSECHARATLQRWSWDVRVLLTHPWNRVGFDQIDYVIKWLSKAPPPLYPRPKHHDTSCLGENLRLDNSMLILPLCFFPPSHLRGKGSRIII